MTTIELTPADNRKSFYGKAKVIKDDSGYYIKLRLLSYDTIVAVYRPVDDMLEINGYYSPTTARHLNAFLKYIGKPPMTKKEIEKAAELPY